MKHAFIMDPLEGVKAWKDTTYFLMLAAAERGHRVAYLDQRALWLAQNQAHARVTWVEVRADPAQPFTKLGEERCNLSAMDVVWVRTDPPFDRRYFYTTLILDFLPPSTRVINRPSGLRNWNEKLAALTFPEYAPPTLVSADLDAILEFARNHGRITLKPVDGFGGKGIVFFGADDDPEIITRSTANGQHWVIAQNYLPEAKDGDKRILLANGEVLGGVLRVHADNAELNNLDAGGSAHPLTLSARDAEICAALKDGLVAQGIFFAGIDIIGDYLIEVNVTSPTCLQELCQFDGVAHHHQLIAALE